MDKETIIPNCPLDEHPCRDILRKHTHSAPVAPFALTQLRNFCLRQKTEFSFREGLLRTTRQLLK